MLTSGVSRKIGLDTNDPNKVLTVEGENLCEPEIKRHVADAGF